MSTERNTPQKKLIIKYLKSVKTHPNADVIFDNVKKHLPNISKSTVYRNLEQFVREGSIIEIPGKKTRFDADLSEHHHFVCSKCGQVIDLFFNITIPSDKLKLIQEHGHLKSTQVLFKGVCNDCDHKMK